MIPVVRPIVVVSFPFPSPLLFSSLPCRSFSFIQFKRFQASCTDGSTLIILFCTLWTLHVLATCSTYSSTVVPLPVSCCTDDCHCVLRTSLHGVAGSLVQNTTLCSCEYYLTSTLYFQLVYWQSSLSTASDTLHYSCGPSALEPIPTFGTFSNLSLLGLDVFFTPRKLVPSSPLSFSSLLFFLYYCLIFFRLWGRLVFFTLLLSKTRLFLLLLSLPPHLTHLLLGVWEKPPMWKPRLSPRSESKSGSDSNHLHLSELGFLGRSRKKNITHSSSAGEFPIVPVHSSLMAPLISYQLSGRV